MSWPRSRSDSGCAATRTLELADELGGATEGELGVDAVLDRREAKLLEPADLTLSPWFVRELGKRRAAPQRECLPQGLGRDLRLCASSLDHESLEALQIEIVRLGTKLVTRWPGDDRLGAERLAELGDVRLKNLPGRGRGRPAHRSSMSRSLPDRLVRVQHQNRQE